MYSNYENIISYSCSQGSFINIKSIDFDRNVHSIIIPIHFLLIQTDES